MEQTPISTLNSQPTLDHLPESEPSKEEQSSTDVADSNSKNLSEDVKPKEPEIVFENLDMTTQIKEEVEAISFDLKDQQIEEKVTTVVVDNKLETSFESVELSENKEIIFEKVDIKKLKKIEEKEDEEVLTEKKDMPNVEMKEEESEDAFTGETSEYLDAISCGSNDKKSEGNEFSDALSCSSKEKEDNKVNEVEEIVILKVDTQDLQNQLNESQVIKSEKKNKTVCDGKNIVPKLIEFELKEKEELKNEQKKEDVAVTEGKKEVKIQTEDSEKKNEKEPEEKKQEAMEEIESSPNKVKEKGKVEVKKEECKIVGCMKKPKECKPENEDLTTFSSKSQKMICPHCKQEMQTEIQIVVTRRSFMATCGNLCPCVKSCRDKKESKKKHFCSNCNFNLGTYSPVDDHF